MSALPLSSAGATTGLTGTSEAASLRHAQVRAGRISSCPFLHLFSRRGGRDATLPAHTSAPRTISSARVSSSVFHHPRAAQSGSSSGSWMHSGDARTAVINISGGSSRGSGVTVRASSGEAAAAAQEAELKQIKETMGERRAVDRSETLSENPYAPVESAMTSPAVTTTPDTLVSTLLESFQHFTGLPVVDDKGRCVGIVSSVDVFEHQRKASPSITDVRVKDIMTAPALVIIKHAPIAYAAGLMLKHKVHRLPVVDNSEDMRVLGIVTRTDIYEPLLPPVNPLFHQLAGFSSGSGLGEY